MNDELRRKAVVRKATYFGIILALFTVSMFWRGVFRLPVGDPDQVAVRDEHGNPVPLELGDRVARLPIRYQAEDMELLERDLGDPEVAGSLAQVSLVGMRGLVVTWLWNDTINNQKRGEYHEMERNARLLTKVQPHFIAPWIFQAWNITYNVSVETDKMGDQYYYIARGISLLAEGDRANTRPHRHGKEVYTVGSPDIRYQLGFFAQNKFSVSDKVNTLYSLAQLSLLPPSERSAGTYRGLVNGEPTGPVDLEKYRTFCENNPQLVRRLKTHLNLKKPEQVMDFLEANWRIPAQYAVDGPLAGQRQPDDKAFPVLPVLPPEGEGPDPQLASYLGELRAQEVLGTAAGRDALDIRMYARAWFEHAQTVVPPPKVGVPSMSPSKGEYDPFRYRIPERPSLIVFRMSPPRAQNYVAERLQKEGWFDTASVWDPDAASDRDAKWFPASRPGQPAREVLLRAGTGARAEWEKTFRLWEEFGRKNGLRDEDRNAQQELALATVRAGLPPLSVPLTREVSDAELQARHLRREHIDARFALMVFEQNRQVTNYLHFLELSLAEMEPDVARARQAFWNADELHARNDEREVGERIRASALWRRVFTSQKHRQFYHSDRSESLHEVTLAQEVAIADLLSKSGDPDTVRRTKALREGVTGLAPSAAALTETQITRVAAQEEAQVRIALALIELDPTHELARRAADDVDRFKREHPNVEPPTVAATARGLLEGEFAWMKLHSEPVKPGTDPEKVPYWVQPTVRISYLFKAGLIGDPEANGLPPGLQPGQGGLPPIPQPGNPGGGP